MSVRAFRSLRLRLIASVVAIEVVMLSLLVWNNMAVIYQAHTDRLRDTAASMLQQIATTSGSYMVEVDYASLTEYLHNIATHPELAYLAVLDRDARPVIRIGRVPAGRWPRPDRHPAQVDDSLFDVASDIRFGERTMGRVLMGFSLAKMEQAIAAARVRSIAIAGTEIILTIVVTVLIGLHLTRRLGQLAAAAQRVGAGDYAVAVPTGVEDEVGMTAAAFNRMVAEVSQRTRRLEQALARERVIEETAIDGMITYDAECRIVSVNPAMEHLFGYPRQALPGRGTGLLVAPIGAGHNGADVTAAEFWTRPTGTRREVTGRRRDGGCFPMELYIGRVDVDGAPLYAATLHDITERKRAEHECRSLLDSNRFLIRKSLAVQEQERRRLARELHDELGQCMTAIQADAELIREAGGANNPRIATSAAAIVAISSRMYDVVHSMMQRLRPTVLDDLGLVAALQEEVEAWRGRHPEVHCELDARGDLGALGEPVNITLYRIVQESLTNVAKHAQATRVSVRLQAPGAAAGAPAVILETSDNGRGMDTSQPGRGLGLIGMRERVEALNGRLDIVSAPGRGVRIGVTIPLSPATEAV